MKAYRFYAEMPEDRGSKSASKRYDAFTRKALQTMAVVGQRCNVIAVLLDKRGRPLWHVGNDQMDAICPMNDLSNAQVQSGSPSRGYLRERCVRIDEDLARKLHPRLFAYLDYLEITR